MHHLIAHTIPNVLKKYHTVGYFTEDALESIHAFLVNKLCQKYIQIGGYRKVTQVLRSLQFQKQDLHLTKSKAVKEEKKRSTRTSRTKQGMGKAEKEPVNSKVTTMLEKIITEHTIQNIEEYMQVGGGNLTVCEICSKSLQKDIFVPEKLIDFHHLCVHVESENKFHKN